MTRGRRLWIIGCLAAGCRAGGSPVAHPGELAGCYDLTVGEWTLLAGEWADSFTVATPPRIRLHSLRTSLEDEHYVLDAAPGALPSIHSRKMWRVISDDSISLLWSTGQDMVEMRLGVDGGAMGGVATAWGGGGSDIQTAALSARKVICGAELQEEHQARYRLPRGIALSNGDSIRLDERAPADMEVDGTDAAWRTTAHQSTGLFAGSVSIRARVDRRTATVGSIDVTYSSDLAWPAFVDRLVSELGAPTDVFEVNEKGMVIPAYVRWRDRMSDIAVARMSDRTSGTRVHLMLSSAQSR